MRTKEQVQQIVDRLLAEYPEADCTLEYRKPYELLFSVRLAAQCTDEMNIMADKKGKKGNIVVTFNEMTGGAYSCTGKVEGDSIFFNPYEFSTRFTSADSVVNLIQLGHVYTIQSQGKGVIHDNIILMEEHWMGRPENGEMIRMKADKITLLAEEN